MCRTYVVKYTYANTHLNLFVLIRVRSSFILNSVSKPISIKNKAIARVYCLGRLFLMIAIFNSVLKLINFYS